MPEITSTILPYPETLNWRSGQGARDGELTREGAATALADVGGAPKFGVRGYTNVWYPWMSKGDTDVVLRV